MKRVAILGSTGSIGRNCLEVIEQQRSRFRVQYLTANGNVELLLQQAKKFRPRAAAVLREKESASFSAQFKELGVELLTGFEGLLEISQREDADIVVNALVGAAGLQPTLSALQRRRRVALANKESLVMGGQFVMAAAEKVGAEIIPIDSEHSALLQCLAGEDPQTIAAVILTASGGPFRKRAVGDFPQVTVEQALNHPNWNMGKKITIDSATLMNKGLEVIEAHWLFKLAAAKIKVVIHPQSIIHSLVEFRDGSVKAQLGLPDMRLPIQYALTYPQRLATDFPRLDFRKLKDLTFEEPDFDKFRCLKLCYEALESGGAAPAVLNAANEEAVHLFLNRKIGFHQIPRIVEGALSTCRFNSLHTVEELLEYDRWSREFVRSNFNQL
jgi:1-deoxy-D-xylulose-5-phosphate reductoisomerase